MSMRIPGQDTSIRSILFYFIKRGRICMDNKLINIITDEKGQQLVSARELYIGLGLSKSKWARWYKNNIENNEFFKENNDFVRVRLNVEGNDVQDFAITLEFAKHIAMMARTEKSHEYRNYFIQCEKELINSNKLILAKEEIKELKKTIEDFKIATEEAKKQFKPSHKKKLDYNKMIKSLTNNEEEAQIVKDWCFSILQVSKWEDTSVQDSKRILDTITTVARMLTIKNIQQLSLFNNDEVTYGK